MSVQLLKICELSKKEQSEFKLVISYLTKFLTSKHPGRAGDVCPFMKKTLDNQSVYVAICETNDAIEIDEYILEAYKKIKLLFKNRALDSKSKVNISLSILFREDISLSRLEESAQKIRQIIMESGLMIASLGGSINLPSLHHEDFFPFRCPQNIVVIRNMIPRDVEHIANDGSVSRKRRIKMLEAYIEVFSTHSSRAGVSGVDFARRKIKKLKSALFWI